MSVRLCRRLALVALAFVMLPLAGGSEARGEVLVDQLSGATALWPSQEMNNLPSASSQAADDFLVSAPPGGVWRIEQIDVDGTYHYGTSGPISTARVTVYETAAGVPGAQLAQQSVTPGGTSSGDLTLPLSPPVELPYGAYWVTVEAVAPTTEGYWAWQARSPQTGSAAVWRSPDVYWTPLWPCAGSSTWTELTGCGGVSSPPDFAFRLLGQSIAPDGGSAPTGASTGSASTGSASTGSASTGSASTGTADAAAPDVTLVVAAERLRVALSKGVKLRVRMSEAGRACAELRLGLRAARRAGLRPTRSERRRARVVVGRRCITFTAAGTRAFRVRFTERAARAFRKLARANKSLTVSARVVATDTVGNRSTTARRLRLAR